MGSNDVRLMGEVNGFLREPCLQAFCGEKNVEGGASL
jgi:hypothetical protein